MNRTIKLLLGWLAALAVAALWHGPLGAGDRLVDRIDATSRTELDRWDMQMMQARAARAPLSRQLTLSGPADEFQRGELVRIMGELPGVSTARWGRSAGGGLPLIAEALLLATAGFLLGLLLAYLFELRRRRAATGNGDDRSLA